MWPSEGFHTGGELQQSGALVAGVKQKNHTITYTIKFKKTTLNFEKGKTQLS